MRFVSVTIILPLCWVTFVGSLWYGFQFNASYVFLVATKSFLYTDPSLNMNLYLQEWLLLAGVAMVGIFIILRLVEILQTEGQRPMRTIFSVIAALLLGGIGLITFSWYARMNFNPISLKDRDRELTTVLKLFSERLQVIEKQLKELPEDLRKPRPKTSPDKRTQIGDESSKVFLEASLSSMSNLSATLTNWALLLLTATGGLFALEVGHVKTPAP